MHEFKLTVLCYSDYAIYDTKKIKCSHEEILQKAAEFLDDCMNEGFETRLQCHISGKWPSGKKLFIIIFSD